MFLTGKYIVKFCLQGRVSEWVYQCIASDSWMAGGNTAHQEPTSLSGCVFIVLPFIILITTIEINIIEVFRMIE